MRASRTSSDASRDGADSVGRARARETGSRRNGLRAGEDAALREWDVDVEGQRGKSKAEAGVKGGAHRELVDH